MGEFSRDGEGYRSRCKSCQHQDYLRRKGKPRQELRKLDEDTVKNIRADWKGGRYTLDELTKKYGTDVRRIVYNRAYIDPNYVPPLR